VEDGIGVVKDDPLEQRCQRLKLVLSDVDGVLTDGRVVLLPDGRETSAFHIRDGMGIVLAHRAGLDTGIITGRLSAHVAQRASQLNMAVVRQGISSKGVALKEILHERGIEAHEVAYMGDDVNDLSVMRSVGLSGAPADAAFEVRAEAFMVTEARGGRGCFREFLEAILRARQQWDQAVASLSPERSPTE
jgi:3-deoxy-D-manno-octulosonate 8-phosphate phosphatase (KDO 8-P phosphatase)